MPKITKVGGVSDVRVRALLPAVVDPVRPIEEEPWVGKSSETSAAKPPKTEQPKKPGPRSPAPTTGNPSKSTGASTSVPGATTSGPGTGA